MFEQYQEAKRGTASAFDTSCLLPTHGMTWLNNVIQPKSVLKM